MATMTITGTLQGYDGDPSATEKLSIRANVQVIDTVTDVVFEHDTIAVTGGEFSYDCPAPGDGIEPEEFGYIVSGYIRGRSVRWQIPAAAGMFDISDFTATTPLPIVTAESVIYEAVAAEALQRETTDTLLLETIEANDAFARNADNLTSGTVADARIPGTIARDTEVTAAVATEATARAAADTVLDGRLDTIEGAYVLSSDEAGAPLTGQRVRMVVDSFGDITDILVEDI
jgi:hypothetical protein